MCTQPRRIAAISLAKRVASERGEPVGERGGMVGYQVRFRVRNRTLGWYDAQRERGGRAAGDRI